MANLIYGFTALTGGAADALDYIDGDVLVDKDVAIGCVSGVFYTYSLDADSAAAEASPSIIAPYTNAGDKRWILQYASHVQKVADATLSGVPVVLTLIGSDGTTYYIKGYPTKA